MNLCFRSKLLSASNNDQGYVLVGVLFLVMLSLILLAGSVDVAGTDIRTVYAAKERSESYYQAEQLLTETTSWLRQNSTSLALPFSRSNFYTYFDRSTLGVGSNDASSTVPTKIKRRATSQSMILSDDTTLATSYFPSTTDTITGAAFNPQTAFAASSFNNGSVRITLIDAIADDPAKDYGDPDNGFPNPDTDFHPMYRLDVMTGQNRGAYLSAYLVGALQFDYGVGFYGKDYNELRQDCDSYISNNGPYSNASKRPNCTAGSDTALRIQSTETIYGTARSNGVITTSSPFGGKVCADFTAGCPNPGQTCSGATCKVPSLPTYSAWNTYCPVNKGNLTVNANATLLVLGNAANQKCWATVTVQSNKTLTLKTTTYSYFIDTFDIANNGIVNFAPDPATGTINLYVRKFVGDKFNGNQVFNTNNKPYQLRLHYLGTDALTLNGNAAMHAFLVAPYATVNVQGNFTYSGGIKALALVATGSGDLHYDESGDITTISDVAYQVRDIEQKYQ